MKRIIMLLYVFLLLISCGGEDDKVISATGRGGMGRNYYSYPDGNFSISTYFDMQGYLGGHSHRYQLHFHLHTSQYNARDIVGKHFTIYAIQSNKPAVNIYNGTMPTGRWADNGSRYIMNLSGQTFHIPCTLLTKSGYSWNKKLLTYVHVAGLSNLVAAPGTYNGYSIFEVEMNLVKPEPSLSYANNEISKNQIIDAGTISTSKTFEFTLTNRGTYGYNLLGNPAVSVSGASDISVIQQPSITNIKCKIERQQVTFRLRVDPSGDALKTAVVQLPMSVDTENTPNTFSIRYRTGELPSVAITSHPTNALLAKNVAVSGTAADATSGVQKVEWSINGGAWKTANGTTSWNFNIETRDYPDGNYTLSVRVTDNSGNTTVQQLSVTFRNSQFSTPQIVKEGDFNNDGKTDFVIIPSGNAVYTYLSQASGSYSIVKYSPSADYQTVGRGVWFAGDINGDGKADLVHVVTTGVNVANYMHTWISTGSGTYNVLRYEPSADYNNASGEWRSGDFNGDGKMDLAHLVDSNYIHIHFGQSSGLLQVTAPFYPTGVGGGYQVIGAGKWLTGDFNNDNKDDLIHIVTVGPKDYMHPWLSNGDGTFDVKTYTRTGYDNSSGDWKSGDFNGDGATDLVHLTGANCTYVHHATGIHGQFVLSGTFMPPSGYALHNTGYWRTGDFNGDGKTDLVHIGTVNAADYVYTWLSLSSGTFNVVHHQHATYTTTDGVWGIGKVNGDNQDDLMHIPHGRFSHPWYSNGSGGYSIQKWFYE